MRKLVFTTWIGTALSGLFVVLFTIYGAKQPPTIHLVYLLAAIILAYLPLIIVYQYISIMGRRLIFLFTTSVVLGMIYFVAPYIGQVIFYIVPIYAVLFKKKLYFVCSFLFSIVCYGIALVLQPELSFVPLYELLQLIVFLIYSVILYFVSTISVKQEKLNSMYTKTMEALVLAIEAKDEYTRGHSTRVSEYSMIIGATLKNYGFSVDLEVLRISSLLHDIGKVNIPSEILQKKEKLSKEEYEIIKKHPTLGAEIARSLEFPEEITEPILYHHERMDGYGYPHGLQSEEIPLLARIIAIADTFDALTTNRPYRKAYSIEEAKQIIIENSSTQFDEKLIPYFHECFSTLKMRAEQLIEMEKQLMKAMDDEFYHSSVIKERHT